MVFSLHRVASSIWSGTLCLQFFIIYFTMLKKNKKAIYNIHKWVGWIMTFSVILNILTGLILMNIKTKQDSNAQSYGLLSAAVYSFIARCLLIINVIIYPKHAGHKRAAIRLMGPLSSSLFFWDASIAMSGHMIVIPFEYYIWKKNYHF
ncbi:unnamed protein product [Cunninghamella echinulata]